MNYCRREILKGAAVIGTGPLLSACESIPSITSSGSVPSSAQPRIEDTYRSLSFSTDNKLASNVTAEQRAQSRISKGIFDEIQLTGLIPKPLAMPTEREVHEAIAAFHKVRDRFTKRRDLNSEEGVEIAKHLIPLLRMYTDFHASNPTKGIQGFAKGGPTVAQDGTLTLPPGFRASTIQDGFCLDQELPAPIKGEIFRLSPSVDLIPIELQALYRALQIKAYQDPEYRPYMQELLWTLRSAGNPQGLAANPSNRAVSWLNKAMLNGADIVARYHQAKLPPPPAASSFGNLFRLENNWGKQDPEKILQGLIRGLSGKAEGAIAADDRNYQMLTPNVASFAIGADHLKPRVDIVNTGETPFTINFADWIATPSRKVQRVGLYPTISQNIKFQAYPISYLDMELEIWSKLKNLVSKEVLEGVVHFGTGIALKEWSKSSFFVSMATKATTKEVASALGKVTPAIGNVLCLYEAVTGHDWLTGADLNAFQRAAAGLGTIPAVAPIMATKGAAIKIGGMLLTGVGIGANMNVSAVEWAVGPEITKYFNEVAAYSKAFSNPLSFPLDYLQDKMSGQISETLVKINASEMSSRQRSFLLKYMGSNAGSTPVSMY